MLKSWWKKNTVVSLLSLGILLLTTSTAYGETAIEKIARTGKITAGTSKDAIPFAYRNQQGELIGYSIDILELITQQLETDLKQDLELELVPLQPKQRIPKLRDGSVDIVCDASSFTWQRDRLIDFSLSYSSTGTRLLVKNSSNYRYDTSFAGKRIGALAQTTNEKAIRRAQPSAEIVIYKDRAAAYQALDQGKIDAFADDGILLESWLRNISNPQDFQVFGEYSREGIACMVAENNSQLLNTVNYTLANYMQGFLAEEPEYVEIFERWFGAQGILPLTDDLRLIMIDNMQLLLDFTQRVPDNNP